ncbi:hypothetical protein Tco_1398278, partial [Tanacetum coccineum]
MSTPKFAETHNLVAFLEKPEESNGFEEIIDFLNTSSVQYALTINPTIYTTWNDLKLDDAEGTDCLPTATIFAELERMGFENLTQKLTFYKTYFSSQWKFLIHTILQCLSAKTTSWNEFSSTIASAIIRLATNKNFNFSKYIFDNMVKNLEGRVKFLMYPRFVQVFLDKQVEGMYKHKGIYVIPFHTMMVFSNMKRPGKGFSGKQKSRRIQRKDSGPIERIPDKATIEEHVATPSCDPPRSEPIPDEATNKEHVATPSYDPPQSETTKSNKALEIKSLKRRVKSLEKRRNSRTPGFKRLRKVGSASRVESSNEVSLVAQKDASKQGRKIADLDADVEVTLVDETQEMNDDNLMFDTCVLEEQEKDVAEKEVSVVDPVTTANVEVTTVNAPTTTIDELTLAQT